jgi:hypothetical protein
MNKKFIILAVTFLSPVFVFAHPGNTDAYGCHTCRTNCSKWGLSQGEYHCHRSKGLEQPKAPVRSSATGVTVPAPEYKTPVVKTPKVENVPQSKVSTTTPSLKITPTERKIKSTAPQKSWLQTFFSKVF